MKKKKKRVDVCVSKTQGEEGKRVKQKKGRHPAVLMCPVVREKNTSKTQLASSR